MVVTVKVTGLNIVRARGKWYVYYRPTGERLLGPIEAADKDEVKRLIDTKSFVAKWNSRRPDDRPPSYEDGTLGALIRWFETECPKYVALSEATKKDYSSAFQHLRKLYNDDLADFTTAELYVLRDQCAIEKWPRFADKMISALSSMFTQAVKRGKMQGNPALGIDKCHKSDPNANREWQASEWEYVVANAPAHILTPMMIARHAGYRGQTIVKLRWNDYQADPRFGRCFRVVTKKNKELVWIPATDELQAHLDAIERTALEICTKADGTPWESEVQMQTTISHYLRELERQGKIGGGTTLHGLRTTYAADLKRSGAQTGDVAAALGDKSERMGAHYTRHVENEAKVIRAFEAKKKR